MTQTYDVPEVRWKDEDEVNGVPIGPTSINGEPITRGQNDPTPVWLPKPIAQGIARALDGNFFES